MGVLMIEWQCLVAIGRIALEGGIGPGARSAWRNSVFRDYWRVAAWLGGDGAARQLWMEGVLVS